MSMVLGAGCKMGEKPVWSLLLSYYLLIQSSYTRQNINSIERIAYQSTKQYATFENSQKVSFGGFFFRRNIQEIGENEEKNEQKQGWDKDLFGSMVKIIDLIMKNSKMNIYLIALTFTLALSQLPQQPPPKFALLTVTHTRNNSYGIIQDYLKHYAESQCCQKMISQICIVWNNELLPQDAGVMDRQLYWRMPVYFFLTKNNSLNHRFRVPKEANAQVFYSLDDDIRVDCGTLDMTYQHYLKEMESSFGRIISNQVRNYGYFTKKKTEFFYQGHSYAKYFSISQTGASFYPKHYLNLYYLKLKELNDLRERVQNITSCEDIFFMAITQHFYPELTPEYYHPLEGYKNMDPKIGLSKKSGLVPLRTSCITYLTDVFGYNPLRHFNKNSTISLQNWQFPNINIIMQTKIKGLINIEMIEVEERTGNSIKNYSKTATVKLESRQQQEQEQEQQASENKEPKQIEKKQVEEMRIKHEKQVEPEQEKQKDKEQLQEKIVIDQSNEAQLSSQKEQKSIASHQLAKERFEIIAFFLIVIIISLLLCIFKLFKMHQQLTELKQRRGGHLELEETAILPYQ